MTIERDIRGPTRGRPAAAAPKDTRERPSTAARGKASPIRAWRAAEPDPSAGRASAKAAAAGFSRGAGARSGALERVARTRAIEQAWKEELARQVELDAEEPPLAPVPAARRAPQAEREPAR